MLVIDELLQPISVGAASGESLRYDPVFDNILEALREDDDSLPVGNWERQVKRADYPMAASVSREALQQRSKDLWLAAWLGLASVHVEGFGALPAAIGLLTHLQQEFWLSLYPEIDDGDLSLRAAPLQWALNRFASQLRNFPMTHDGVPYAAYQTVSMGLSGADSPDGLTSDALAAALSATPTTFYDIAEQQLSQAHVALAELQRFCDARYGEEGPSFAQMRGVLEDVLGVFVQQQRARRSREPVPPSSDAPALPVPPAHPDPSVDDPIFVPDLPSVQPESPQSVEPIGSFDQAVEQLRICAAYLFDHAPQHVSSYLLALALNHAQVRSMTSSSAGYPSSEARIALKRARDGEDWKELLGRALSGIAGEYDAHWLDAERYAWQAAQALGAEPLQELISAMVRQRLATYTDWSQIVFEDGTPVASPETQRWLEDEVSEVQVEAVPAEQPKVQEESRELATPPSVTVIAQALAERGLTGEAIALLLEARAQSGRESFLNRMEICRLSLRAGQTSLAVNMLRHMMAEVEERRLSEWEDRDLLGELISMLLEAANAAKADAMERQDIYARLCRVDPVRAFDTQPGT
jgi:type VI secretion system protein ImpA